MNNLEIDARIREALTPPDDQVDRIHDRFMHQQKSTHQIVREDRPLRSRVGRRVRGFAMAGVIAAAAMVGVAVLPSGDKPDGSGGGISLAPTANAAEAMDWAADAVLEAGSPEVPAVWHSSSSTLENGQVARFEERWYDPSTGGYSSIVAEEHGVAGAVLWTVEFDGDRTISRSYRRDASGTWGLNSTGPNLNIEGIGLPDVEVATRVNGWLSVASANPSRSQLADATEKFFAETAESFQLPNSGAESEANARVRQAAFLLSVASASPQAMSAVYGSIASFDDLRRLEAAPGELRIALEDVDDLPYSDAIRPRVQTVAVLDAATGMPLRFESLNRSVVRSIAKGDAVDALGEGRLACGPASRFLPCDVFEEGSALRRQADEFAATPSSGSKADAWRNGVSTLDA